MGLDLPSRNGGASPTLHPFVENKNMTLIRSRSNGLIINGATEAARDVIRTNAGTLAEIVGGTRPVPAPTELPPPPQGAPAPAAGGYPCKMRPHFAWGPGEGWGGGERCCL